MKIFKYISARHATRMSAVAFLLTAMTAVAGCGNPEDAEDDAVSVNSAPLTFINVEGTTSPFFNDAGTQCTITGRPSFHCCPAGTVMVGAHLGNNVFRCARVNGLVTNVRAVLGSGASGSIQRNGALSCEPGKVMIGYDRGAGFPFFRAEMVQCGVPPGKVIGFEYPDDGRLAISQDAGMHVCRKDTVNDGRFAMSGINAAQNVFNCLQ